MEEEAGEGEGERKQGCEVQGEAREEAAKVSAKGARMPSFRCCAPYRQSSPDTFAQKNKRAFLPIHSFANHSGKILFCTLELKWYSCGSDLE